MSIINESSAIINGISYHLDLENIITSGGNGEVYYASSEEDGNEYAIKILKNTRDEEKKKRFLSEIKFCKDKRHSGIIKIIDSGEYKNHLFYVMPKYPHTLASTLNNREYSLKERIKQVKQLCEAIQYIHDHNVIHRDLKPENIMVDNDGNIIIADFGIAHFIDSTITNPNDLLANRNYAAPEQRIVGNSLNISKACDIFALGLIINEMFTGLKPDGTNYISISDRFPFLSFLDSLVYECIHQNPEERPTIRDIWSEIQLSFSELEDDLSLIESDIFESARGRVSQTFSDNIKAIASMDILSAKCMLEAKSFGQRERLNCNYHSFIHYQLSSSLTNLFFQKTVLYYCERKFEYESHSYLEEKVYTPLDLAKTEGKALYNKCKSYLEKYPVYREFENITAMILKTFSSCCDYHCRELLDDISEAEKQTNDLNDAPIFYIVYKLKTKLNLEEITSLPFDENVSIIWEKSMAQDNYNESLFINTSSEEVAVLSKLASQWNVSYRKIDTDHFSIQFRKEIYLNFKSIALKLSKPHYVFEGDVIDLLRIRREYNGIIELMPVNSFDILSTIAKIIGLRKDY